VARLLAHLRPRLVVGAAAAGADLLVAEAAARENIPVHVALPHPRATFRVTSVQPGGASWLDRFDRLLDDPGAVHLDEGALNPSDVDAYRTHNGHLLDRASTLVEQDERVWCLVVRPAATTPSSVSDDLAERAQNRGLTTVDLDPTITLERRRTAFVAMPYGTKFDPVTRRVVNCDDVFYRVYVPVLEDLDLEWQRADLEADSGVVHVGMIDALANVDVVIADMFTGNANVAYELGVRHALAPRATMITRPQLAGFKVSQPVPFDVLPSRHVAFGRSVDAVTDDEAGAAVAGLRRTLVGVLANADADSPVFGWFDRDSGGRLTRRDALADASAAESVTRARVQAASASASVARLLLAAEEVAGAQLAEPARRHLRFQLAVDLSAQHAFDQATELYLLSEPPVEDPLRLRWLQQYALSLSWQGRSMARREDDPSEVWERAERLLDEATNVFGDSEETCGVAGGIVKRRFERALADGDPVTASASLGRMLDLYHRGFQSEPSYYAGVNLVAALRLGVQHFDRGRDDERELHRVLPVADFFARREVEDDPQSFWALATLAEIGLHRAMLAETDDIGPVVAEYQRATRVRAPAAWLRSATDQLRIFKLCGDPGAVIDPIIKALGLADG